MAIDEIRFMPATCNRSTTSDRIWANTTVEDKPAFSTIAGFSSFATERRTRAASADQAAPPAPQDHVLENFDGFRQALDLSHQTRIEDLVVPDQRQRTTREHSNVAHRVVDGIAVAMSLSRRGRLFQYSGEIRLISRPPRRLLRNPSMAPELRAPSAVPSRSGPGHSRRGRLPPIAVPRKRFRESMRHPCARVVPGGWG